MKIRLLAWKLVLVPERNLWLSDVNICVSWEKYDDIRWGTNKFLLEFVYFCEWAIFCILQKLIFPIEKDYFLGGINNLEIFGNMEKK